jgi:hypothetical protein
MFACGLMAAAGAVVLIWGELISLPVASLAIAGFLGGGLFLCAGIFRDLRELSEPVDDVAGTFSEISALARSRCGATIKELSQEKPLLLIFLRHAGCTFCRETLDNLTKQRAEIERAGFELAIVSMGQPMDATLLLSRYGLDDVDRFVDCNCSLYRSVALPRGNFRQLFGPHVLYRGLVQGALFRHGMGKLCGDGFQLSGAFVVDRGELVSEFRSQDAADLVDFEKILSVSQPLLDRRNEALQDHAPQQLA